MAWPEDDAGLPDALTSFTQTVHVETGFGYGVMFADLHVSRDRGPVYVLVEHQAASAPEAASDRSLEQPSRLLDARAKVVAFTGREQELTKLTRWRDTRGSRLSARWLHGPGGSGKTRLAEEFAEACAAAGWKVVTALYGPGAALPQLPSQNLRTDKAAGLLVVVDYADRWPLSHLTLLLSNALLHRDVPTRLLLVARSAYPWPAVQAVLGPLTDDSEDLPLAPLPGAAEPAARQRMFTAARDAFAARYGVADPSRIPVPHELEHPGFGLTLTVHMAALVAVDAHARGGTAPTDPAGLSVYLLNRERGNWARLHEIRIEGGEFDTPPSVMARLVFAAALTGATGHGDGARLLEALEVAGHPDRLLRDHGFCYPPTQPGTVLEPLYPDRLAEDFLALTLPGHRVTGYAPGIWATQDTAAIVLGEGAAPRLGRAMTFLAAAAAPGRWPHVAQHVAELLRADPTLAAAAGGGALAALADLDDLDPEVLAAVDAHLPEGSRVDLDLGIAALISRLTRHRLAGTTDPAARALLYTTLARRSANAGLYQQAAEAAEQAVTVLQTADAAQAGPDLAAALHEQCRALAAIEQATAIYRGLAEADPTYVPRLADSLYLLGRELADPGRMPQAVAAAEESVAAYRTLIRGDPTAVPGFATALNSLAVRLGQAGRVLESLAPLRETVAIRRAQAQAEPGGYLPGLATALNNLGGALPHLERREEALLVTEEAVAIRRQLAEANPHAFRPALAISLMNLGIRQSEIGRSTQAVAPAREAVEIYRELAETDPLAIRPFLGQALVNLAGHLAAAHLPDAVATGEEAVALARILAADRPETFRPLLAKALNNLSVMLSAARRNKQALVCIEEAVEVYAELAEAHPDAYLSRYANALENLGVNLENLKRPEQARAPAAKAAAIRRQLAEQGSDTVAAARAAVEVSRELAAMDPDAYLPDLAGALARLGTILIEHRQVDESLVPIDESVTLYRGLAEDAPELYRRRLASALQLRVNALVALGRAAEAPHPELVAVLRRLVEENPAHYQPALARALYNAAIADVRSGEFEGTAELLDEAIELYVPLARQDPDLYKAELRAARDLANRLRLVPQATAKLQNRLRRHGLRPTWMDRLGMTSGPVMLVVTILLAILAAVFVLIGIVLDLVFIFPFRLVRAAWRRVSR